MGGRVVHGEVRRGEAQHVAVVDAHVANSDASLLVDGVCEAKPHRPCAESAFDAAFSDPPLAYIDDG